MMSIIKFNHIFLFALFIRVSYFFAASLINFEPTSCCDWSRYDNISNNIINGNFNLDAGPFVIAPIFPYFVSLIKLLNFEKHILIIQIIQIFLSSISVIYLMKITQLLFHKRSIIILVGIIYSIYPFTFWYTFFLGQETIFQFFFILSIYNLILLLKNNNLKNTTIFSFFFSLAFLTKSHVLIFLPFVFLILLISNKKLFKTLKSFISISFLVFLFALPHGISNKIFNGFYVLSTTGIGHHFLVGHNDDFYKMVTNPPPKESAEYKRIWSMDYIIMRKIETNFSKMDHLKKDRQRLIEGIKWINNNPKKAVNLFIINTINFFKPGFNKLHHDYFKWLVSFLISLPIFILAYLGMLKKIYEDFSNHTIIVSLLLTMYLFSVVFYSQNRFRVITIEPFYIIYGSYYLQYLLDKYFKLNSFKNN